MKPPRGRHPASRTGAVAGLFVALALGCGKKPAPAPEPAAEDRRPDGPTPAAPGPPSERDKLLTTLKTKRGDAQREAVDTLGELAATDPAVPNALVELLRDRTTAGPGQTSPTHLASVREAAAVALLRAGPKGRAALQDKGLSALRDGLTDKDPAVREHTAHTLGVLGPAAKPVAAAVQRLCADPDPRVRPVAFDAVAAIGSPDVPALAALLNHQDPDIRGRAAEVVTLLTDVPAAAVPSCTLALLADDEAVRVAAANGIAASNLTNATRQTAENLTAAIRKSYPDLPDPAGTRLDGPEAAYWRALAKCGKAAVSPAADLLTHPHPIVRMLAARTLGGLGDEAKPAVVALDRALNDPYVNVSLEVACTLTRLGEKADGVAALVKAALASTAPGVAAAAVEAIARMGPAGKPLAPLAVDKLTSLLPDARYAAVAFIGLMPPAEAVAYLPGLARAVGDRERLVRGRVGAVLEALGPAAAPAAGAIGRQLAAETDESVRDQFVDTLTAIGPGARPAVPELLTLLAAGPTPVRVRVMTAVVAADPASPEVAAAVTKAAGDADPTVRVAAASALGKLDPLPDDARNALVTMARSDAKSEARAAAVRGLAAAGPRAKAARPDLEAIAGGTLPGLDLWAKVAVAALDGDATKAADAVRAGLTHRNPNVRAAAAEALMVVGPTAADVPTLVKLAREPGAAAREAAAIALGRIGPDAKAAVPRLAALLTAREGEVRAAAAEALGRIGPAAAAAIPRLKTATKDPSSGSAARRALEKLGATEPGPGR